MGYQSIYGGFGVGSGSTGGGGIVISGTPFYIPRFNYSGNNIEDTLFLFEPNRWLHNDNKNDFGIILSSDTGGTGSFPLNLDLALTDVDKLKFYFDPYNISLGIGTFKIDRQVSKNIYVIGNYNYLIYNSGDGFISNYIFGHNNVLLCDINSSETFVLGSTNYLSDTRYLFNSGFFNSVLSSINSTIIGLANSSINSYFIFFYGSYNNVSRSVYCFIMGRNNTINNCSEISIFGGSNIVYALQFSSIIGIGNLISNSNLSVSDAHNNIFVFGNNCKLNANINYSLGKADNMIIIGIDNNIGDKNINYNYESTFIGHNIYCNTCLSSLIIGSNINVERILFSYVIGYGNNIYSAILSSLIGNFNSISKAPSIFLLGNFNNINYVFDLGYTSVIGNGNNIRDLYNSSVIGSLNTAQPNSTFFAIYIIGCGLTLEPNIADDNKLLLGTYNEYNINTSGIPNLNDDYILLLGNGSSNFFRSNCLYISKSGKMVIGNNVTRYPNSTIHNKGSLSEDKITIVNSATYYVVESDLAIYCTGNCTIFLPVINSTYIEVGKVYEIYSDGTGIVTINSAAGDTINETLNTINLVGVQSLRIKALSQNKWRSI